MLNLICVSVSALFIVNAFDDYMSKGMILRPYKYWLTIITLRARIFPFLYKPLGGCMPCTLVWGFVLMFFLNNYFIEAWLFLFGIGMAHWFYKILNRYELL